MKSFLRLILCLSVLSLTACPQDEEETTATPTPDTLEDIAYDGSQFATATPTASPTATATPTPTPTPVITTQPASATIANGATTTLSVVATGATAYQWYTGASTAIDGATSSSYTTPALTATTTYWVSVSNSGGGVTSNTVTITVNPVAPTITSEPAAVTIANGATTTLSVTATSTGLSYQWYQGITGDTTLEIAGATSESYTTPALTASTSYWVAVSNAGGSIDSATATVTVLPVAPVITTNPSSTTITTGTTTILTVIASGTGLTYQWYEGASPITATAASGGSGSTTASFTTPILTADQQYWVQVTNLGGTTNSNTATITVTP